MTGGERVLPQSARAWAFWVEGHPVPQPRMTRAGRGAMAQHPVWAWRDAIGWRAKEAGLQEPLPKGTPVEVIAHFWLKSSPTSRPDLDNLLKAVEDALIGVAYEDDAQVVRLTGAKLQVPAGGRGEGVGVQVLVGTPDAEEGGERWLS